MSGPALVLRADPRRLAFVLPTLLLAGLALAPPLVWLARPHGAFPVVWWPVLLLVLLHGFYVRLTSLTLAATGLRLRQPFTDRWVAYADIAGMTVMSMLDVGSPGGVAAGVRLRLRNGQRVHIPDVFTMRRAALAARIGAQLRAG